ncbi:MAG: hypothetical protein QXP81_09680 [Nitrososphaerota archaeon]
MTVPAEAMRGASRLLGVDLRDCYPVIELLDKEGQYSLLHPVTREVLAKVTIHPLWERLRVLKESGEFGGFALHRALRDLEREGLVKQADVPLTQLIAHPYNVRMMDARSLPLEVNSLYRDVCQGGQFIQRLLVAPIDDVMVKMLGAIADAAAARHGLDRVTAIQAVVDLRCDMREGRLVYSEDEPVVRVFSEHNHLKRFLGTAEFTPQYAVVDGRMRMLAEYDLLVDRVRAWPNSVRAPPLVPVLIIEQLDPVSAAYLSWIANTGQMDLAVFEDALRNSAVLFGQGLADVLAWLAKKYRDPRAWAYGHQLSVMVQRYQTDKQRVGASAETERHAGAAAGETQYVGPTDGRWHVSEEQEELEGEEPEPLEEPEERERREVRRARAVVEQESALQAASWQVPETRPVLVAREPEPVVLRPLDVLLGLLRAYRNESTLDMVSLLATYPLVSCERKLREELKKRGLGSAERLNVSFHRFDRATVKGELIGKPSATLRVSGVVPLLRRDGHLVRCTSCREAVPAVPVACPFCGASLLDLEDLPLRLEWETEG